MNHKARLLKRWSWLMLLVTIILVTAALLPGFQNQILPLTITGGFISITWVGFLLNAI